MKPIFFTICLSIISIAAFAQLGKDYRSLGDQSFNNKDYYAAAYYYKKAAEGLHISKGEDIPFQFRQVNNKNTAPTDQVYVSFKLAESYRGYENFIEAQPWYFKVITANGASQYPLATLWYGVCLRATQNFDEAIKQLQQFKAVYKKTDNYTEIADKEIANCNFAKDQNRYPHLLAITKMKGSWNSDGSDYSIIRKDRDFMFTSSRLAKDDKKHLNRVYEAREANSFIPEEISLKFQDDSKDTEFGTPALSPDNRRLYFTKWYKKGNKSVYAIYYSEFKDKWMPPRKLNINVNAEGYNAIQPFITNDGKRLFFVSNKPGGQGGDDIWMSNLGDDGDATNSVNLGPGINTPQDEQAPYYNAAKKLLIYSSKGFVGLGGFDFFIASGDMGNWTKPINMGYPMNSAKDDLYFLPDNDNPGKYFISSDRESDCCLDLFEVYDKKFTLTGMVTDCGDQLPLPGVKVSFIDSISKNVLKEEITGADAKYTYDVTTTRPYSILLEKSGYFNKVFPGTFTGDMRKDSLFSPSICLQSFKPNKPIKIDNVLYDFNSTTLRPQSKTDLNKLVTIMKDNPKIIVELGSHTDSIGTEQYNLKLSQDRAQSCVDYIISQGITDKRIFAKGYGKSKPIAPNSLPNGKDNPDGRQLNRRTEFTVVKTEDQTLVKTEDHN